jgi:hypothetical protein
VGEVVEEQLLVLPAVRPEAGEVGLGALAKLVEKAALVGIGTRCRPSPSPASSLAA